MRFWRRRANPLVSLHVQHICERCFICIFDASAVYYVLVHGETDLATLRQSADLWRSKSLGWTWSIPNYLVKINSHILRFNYTDEERRWCHCLYICSSKAYLHYTIGHHNHELRYSGPVLLEEHHAFDKAGNFDRPDKLEKMENFYLL